MLTLRHQPAYLRRLIAATFMVVSSLVLLTPYYSISAATVTATPGSTIGPTGFIHPGILVSEPQLAYVKGKLASNANPWAATYSYTGTEKASDGQVYGSTSYVPHPVGVVNCDTNDNDCVHLRDDGVAAYTQALLYSYDTGTDRDQHAQKAIQILNAWATTLQSMSSNQARLEAAWDSEEYPRAAEIMRYTYTPPSGELSLNVSAITNMFVKVFQPEIQPGDPSSNGNWELAMADGLINIGIFTDNRTTYNDGLAMWRARVPAYIYESTDNNGNGQPVAPPGGKYSNAMTLACFWLGAGDVTTSCTIPSGFKYTSGMVQETCRDMSHVTLGLESLVNGAETARLQGDDLYGEQKKRIVDAFEFSATFDSTYLKTGSWPTSPCGGQPGSHSGTTSTGDGTGGVGYKLGWEIAYNEYANRLGIAMPATLSFIMTYIRPSAYKASQQIAWETLTHADTGSVPLPSVTSTALLGDINADGKVNAVDLSILLSNWNTSTADSDLNHDGTTNILDLSILLGHWSS